MRLCRRQAWLIGLLLAAGCGRRAATISVTPPKAKIYGIGRTTRVTGKVLDKKGQPLEEGAPTWSSANAAVVEVDSSGRLTAKSEGKTTVKATFEKIEASVPVEVLDVKSVEVAPPSARLIGPAGTQFALEVSVKDSTDRVLSLKPAWSSSDPKIATVSDAGLVTSVASGTTTAIARIGDLQSASEIRVAIQPISKIEIHPATALVRVGDSQKFEIVAYSIDGRPIEGASAIFSTSNPAIAKLDASGRASGVAAGTATIQAVLAGTSAQATLIVN